MSRRRLAAFLLLSAVLLVRAAPGLCAGTEVVGVVVDAAGRPVPGAEVELTRALRELELGSSKPPRDQKLYRARTGSAGRFEIRGVPASWLKLRIEHPDFVPLTREGIRGKDSGGPVDLGKLTLEAGKTVAGIVVDEKGVPLAGTALWIREAAGSGSEDRALLQRGPRQVTGPDGRFSIPHLPEKSGFLLYACRRDRSQFQQDLDRPLPEPFRIVLPSSGRVPGRVTDSDGHPVPGANVGVILLGVSPSDLIDENDPCPWTDVNATAVTDAAGRFVLEPVASGVFRVWVSADGFPQYEQRWMELGGKSGQRRLDIVLPRGISLSGRIRTATGAPASGAVVAASCPGAFIRASADTGGRYRIAGLVAGTSCSVSVNDDKLGQAERTVQIQPRGNLLELRLAPAPDPDRDTVAIRGRVTGPRGEPIPGAQVDARGSSCGETRFTGPDGSFTIKPDRSDPECDVWAWKDGYAASTLVRARAGETPVIRLERALTLTGRLLNLEPEEIGQVYIAAKGATLNTPRGFVYPDGTYRVTDLGPGEWTVSASTKKRGVTAKVTLRPGQPDTTLDLSFPDLYPVSGRVIGPGGEGIAGARVWFGGRDIRTREDGSFEIPLVNGSYEVSAMEPEGAAGGLGETRLPRPVVVADAPVDGVEIQMKRGLVLRGCVPGLLSGESPSILVSNRKTARSLLTGPDGCYRAGDLGPGDWTITARLEDVYPGGENRQIERRVTLSPDIPETTLDLDLALGSRTLTVHPAGAGRPADLYLKLLRADGTALIESIGPGKDGAFHAGRLREGGYRIQIQDFQGKVLIEEPVELTADREIVVEVP